MSSKGKGAKRGSGDDHGDSGGGGGHDAGGGLRWLLTYADMITLLLVFFIIMFVISDTNSKKYEMFAKSVSKGFHGKESTKGAITNPAQTESQVANQEAKIDPEELLKQFNESFSKEKGYGFINLERGKRGITMRLESSSLFEVGTATLTPQAFDALKKLAGDLKYVRNMISVEGHTDTADTHSSEYPTNWELSAKRAVNIVRYLVERGVDPRKLSATAYGEYKPIAVNLPGKGAPENRRVEIIILDEKFMAEYQ